MPYISRMPYKNWSETLRTLKWAAFAGNYVICRVVPARITCPRFLCGFL